MIKLLIRTFANLDVKCEEVLDNINIMRNNIENIFKESYSEIASPYCI